MFNKSVEDYARCHAIKECPNESVGVIVQNEYIMCKNIHKKPTNDFLVSDDELNSIGIENIQAVIHSHIADKGANSVPRLYPSKLDMQTQIAFNVPFGIICCDDERASEVQWWGDMCPINPLVGRFFVHGIYDCYSLIRDYYKLEHNIVIPDFPRDWEWWYNADENMYVKGFAKAGFRQVSKNEIKAGDGFFMPVSAQTVRDNIPCHGGIYLGNDTILHHKSGINPYDKGRLSVRENASRHMKFITHVLRHKDLE